MSNEELRVGSLSALPGEKKFGKAEFLVEGQPFQLPLWLINGTEAGPTLAVTAGVHAAEYASIAAALDLGRSLAPAGMRGRVVVLPVMNVPGFGARSIYICPLDGRNLNRVFPGNRAGTASEVDRTQATGDLHDRSHRGWVEVPSEGVADLQDRTLTAASKA